MVGDYVVRAARWDGRVFEKFEKGLAGETPALFVFFGKGDRVGEGLRERHHGYLAVHGPDEFLRRGEDDVEIEGDENTFRIRFVSIMTGEILIIKSKRQKQGKEEEGFQNDVLSLHLRGNRYEEIRSKTFIGLGRYEMIESHKAQSKGIGLGVLKSSQKNLENGHPIGL